MNLKSIANFIYELGHLKRLHHEGWKLAGIEIPDTVAEHALRAAQIGFMLAEMEGYADPNAVCAMLVFHDMAETRVGDIHKVANRYITADEAGAAREQTAPLDRIGADIFALWQQVELKNTTAGVIAKDADLLEQAVTAKEYAERGFSATQNWIDNVAQALRTESAKSLLATLLTLPAYEWWRGLKKLDKSTTE